MTLAFIAGIALSPHFRFPEMPLSLLKTSFFVFLPLVAVFFLVKKPTTFLCFLLPMSLASGYYHAYVHLQLPGEAHHIYNRIETKKDVVVIGVMSTMAGFDGKTSQVTIETENIRFAENTDLLPTKGKILLRLQGVWPEDYAPGDTLALRTELKRPESFRTPGVFDYAEYLAEKDIWITGFIRSSLFIHKIKEPQSLLHTLRYLPERLRTKIGRQIDSALPPTKSGLYRAILIGDRSQVKETTLEIFKGSGTMHILAISGLHMAIIGTLLYAGIFWLLSRSEQLLLRFTVKKWAAFLSLPVLLGYGLLAGMNTPVFRAVIMSAVVIVAICSNRQKSPGALVAFAAMLILTIDPLQLFTVSFQLSFIAIIGILFLLPMFKKLLYEPKNTLPLLSRKQKIQRWIFAGLLVSLVANLVTVPIALATFNRFSTVGPLANLIVEPLICLWSLTAGFIAIPFIFIHPPTAAFLLHMGGLGLDIALYVAAFFSSLPCATIWLPTPPVWLIFLYFSIIIFFVASGWKNKWTAIPLVSALLVCIWFFRHPLSQYQPPKEGSPLLISYLDVGQGTATLIEYPSGFRVLIDGGGSSFSAVTVGERIIAPFLWSKGIQKIDAIAITHPDADHYNGIEFIIKRFSPKVLWVRDMEGHDVNFTRLVQLAERQKVTVSIPRHPDLWGREKESLKCITNTAATQNNERPVPTNHSGNNGLVLKACVQGFCALFPGDIGRSTEQSLVTQGFDVRADVLLAAHHGSITSNSSQFLEAVSPRYMLVSAGRSSKGYFPHKGLAGECIKQHIDLFTTSAQGTLQIIAKHNDYRLYGYQREKNNPLSPWNSVLLGKANIIPR